jgi:site-specific recombinase XerD
MLYLIIFECSKLCGKQFMRCNIYLWSKPLKNGFKKVKIDIQNGRAFRKYVNTDLRVNPKHWDSKKQRVTKSHQNPRILNNALDELQKKLRLAEDKYHTGQFSEIEVVSFLEGKTKFESIMEYVETEIKNSRTSATYIDYKNAINSLKIYTIGKEQLLMLEDVNFSLLSKFKKNALANGLSGNSVNSYLNKIRAVMNDAYDKGFTFTKFEINKKLRVSVKRKPIKSCTPEDFENAIDKVENIYDWQALGFYLLMFCTRGMYPADIVNFKFANFQNADMPMTVQNTLTGEYFEDDIPIGKVCLDGYDYLIHRRSKTENRSNADMIIRIDKYPTLDLISKLKYSIVLTHYAKKSSIIPTLEDSLSIFQYDVNKDYELHSNVWDTYKKRVTKLLGYSYKTARKTFNTYALELEVSDSTRRILLGHSDPSMLSHYDNLDTETIRKRVEDAHTSVLRRFKTSYLMDLMVEKLKEINAPELLYNDSFWVGNTKELAEYFEERK